jgi:2'-5' RNA ligase
MLLKTREADIPPPDQPTNVFFALRPPWPIAEQFHADAAELCRRAGIVGSRRPFFILHMTMFSLGQAKGRIPGTFLHDIDAAVSMVKFPAFDIVLDEARSFENRRNHVPFVLEGGELADIEVLRGAVRDALHVKEIMVPVRRTFTPHMTLAYASRRSARLKVEPFHWRAREFQLIESWVGCTKYVELARWALWDEPPEPNAPLQPVLA